MTINKLELTPYAKNKNNKPKGIAGKLYIDGVRKKVLSETEALKQPKTE